MESIDEKIMSSFDFLDNGYVSIGLSLGLITFSGTMVNDLPVKVLDMLDKSYVKVILFLLIIIISRRRKTPSLAIALTIAVLSILQALDRYKIDNKMKNLVDKKTSNTEQNSEMNQNSYSGIEQYDPSIIDSEMLETFDNVSEVLGYDNSKPYVNNS
jgi:hypothetical protein